MMPFVTLVFLLKLLPPWPATDARPTAG